jgi:uncharacterized protein YegP (UPF0339 family)
MTSLVPKRYTEKNPNLLAALNAGYDYAVGGVVHVRKAPARKVRLYKAADGWRWRLVAPNGKVLADSGEAYTRRRDCRNIAVSVFAGTGYVVIVDA